MYQNHDDDDHGMLKNCMSQDTLFEEVSNCLFCAQVLLFSTMTRVLDVVEDYLDWRGFEHLRLDGAVSSADRGDLVKRFNAPGKLAKL